MIQETAELTKEAKNQETEQSSGLTNANQKDNSQSSEFRKPIDDSPFVLVKQDANYFVALTNHKLTPNRKTEEEAMNDITAATWNTFVNIVDAMMNIRAEYEKIEKGGQE